jgi:alkylresorcinol/alkylpyrone synthase
LCSLTWQRGDTNPAALIASGSFGDGAVAVLIAGANVKLPGRIWSPAPRFLSRHSGCDGLEDLRKGLSGDSFAGSPECRAQQPGQECRRLPGYAELTRADIGSWIMHTGGPKVLEATAEALGLKNGAAGCLLGGAEAGRQSLVRLGAGGAG